MHRRGEALVALRVDAAENRVLLTGDSSGAVRAWDMSALTRARQLPSTSSATMSPLHPSMCVPLLYLQAHKQSIVSLDYVAEYALVLRCAHV